MLAPSESEQARVHPHSHLVGSSILIWTGVWRGDERESVDCSSIPHTLDQVMLLHRWEKIARSVRMRTGSTSSPFSLRRELGAQLLDCLVSNERDFATVQSFPLGVSRWTSKKRKRELLAAVRFARCVK